jgi:ABC-type Fe3+/spermidine/putrescine transport system ATPase subunit
VKAAAITLTDVTKRFGSHLALDSVSLEVPPGTAAVVLGPSGCGKTTMLRVIAGLEVPDSGQVLLGGATVSAPGRTHVPPHRRQLGFVFQDLALWPHLTVRQNLDFVIGSRGPSRPEQGRRAHDALALVRIEELAGRYPHQLSGGE